MRVVSLALLLGACANSTSTQMVGDVEVITVRRAYANAHLVRAGEGMILVDAGYEDRAPELDKALSKHVDLSELDVVIAAHGHADHAGGINHFSSTYDVPVVGGVGEEEAFDAGKSLEGICPTNALARRRLDDELEASWEATRITHWVDTELPLSTFADMPGRVIRLAGHTPGSLIVEVGNAVFVSDLIRGSVVGRAAALHFYMCDIEDNNTDLRTMLDDLTPDASQFFTGHFGPVTRESIEAYLEP